MNMVGRPVLGLGRHVVAAAVCSVMVVGGGSGAALAQENSCSQVVALDQQGGVTLIDTLSGVGSPLNVDDGALMVDASGFTAVTRDARRGRLFAVTGEGDDSLYSIDTDDGDSFKLASLAREASNIQGIDIAPPGSEAFGFEPGSIYGVSIDGMAGCGPNCLFRIAPDSGEVEALGAIGSGQIRGVSFNPVSAELVAYDAGSRQAMVVDGGGAIMDRVSFPSASQQYQTGLSTVFALTHTGDGRLYGLDIAYGVLVEIDMAAGQAFWVGEYGDAIPAGGSTQVHGLDTWGGAECVSPEDPTPTPDPGGPDGEIDAGEEVTPTPVVIPVFERGVCRGGGCPTLNSALGTDGRDR